VIANGESFTQSVLLFMAAGAALIQPAQGTKGYFSDAVVSAKVSYVPLLSIAFCMFIVQPCTKLLCDVRAVQTRCPFTIMWIVDGMTPSKSQLSMAM
jgi:hypothetical protein